jgi:3-hydroxyisobutyrate dehydrogenase
VGERFFDAPVSGGVKRAVDGSLAIMVGGDAAVFASQRGKVLTHVGPAGAGHAVKALNNYVSAAGGRFDSGFSLALMTKDQATAASLASSIGTPLRLGEAVLDLWAEADTALGRGADHTEMYRWLAPRIACR